MNRKMLYPVYEPKNIPEMTDAEVREALERGVDTVVIGVGSVESHGSGLPLGADMFQVTEFCKRAVVKLAERGYPAIAGPVIPFGMSIYYKKIPGTITLSSGTLKAVIKEVCLCLAHQGFKKFALVLGHGGDYYSMMDAAQELVDETDAQAMFLNWVPAMQARVAEFSTATGPDGHGGEINTSSALAIVPELVRMDHLPAAYVPAPSADTPPSSQVIGEGAIPADQIPPFAFSPLVGGGVWIPIKDYQAETGGAGIMGDPSIATAEKGEKIVEIITNWLADVIAINWGKRAS